MKYKIRPATAEDAYGIARVHSVAWHETYTGLIAEEFLKTRTVERSLSRMQNGWKNMSVAEADGEIVGFCGVSPARDEDLPGVGEVQGLYVLRAYQKVGIGKALLADGVQRLQGQGFSEICLWVLDTNENARRFYESQGFRPDGREKTEILVEPITEIRMRKSVWTA